MKVEQSHARILRECVAKIHRYLPPNLQPITMGALTNYAIAIKEICDHPEEGYAPEKKKFVCLDCLRERDPDKNDRGILKAVESAQAEA